MKLILACLITALIAYRVGIFVGLELADAISKWPSKSDDDRLKPPGMSVLIGFTAAMLWSRIRRMFGKSDL